MPHFYGFFGMTIGSISVATVAVAVASTVITACGSSVNLDISVEHVKGDAANTKKLIDKTKVLMILIFFEVIS